MDQGEIQISKASDYNSHNTYQLNMLETKELLMKLSFMQSILRGEPINTEE
jgi:UDP-glucose 4-epimerase